jgi:hypothetical protein
MGSRIARAFILAIGITATACIPRCYRVRPSAGCGQTSGPATRTIQEVDIALPRRTGRHFGLPEDAAAKHESRLKGGA